MAFTYYNDLSLDYLAPRLSEEQHRLIDFAIAASMELENDYEAHGILRKLLATLRKYGTVLDELLALPRPAAAALRKKKPAAMTIRRARKARRKRAAPTAAQTAA
jgi:hypothetical protein